MVFDDKSSIAFFSLDKELENYISDRIKQLESEAGAKVGLLYHTCVLFRY